MMKLLLFAGTTEGRVFAERLCELPVQATICVATDYGGEVLEDVAERFAIRVGRLGAEGMRALMGEGFHCVVDATHPYAIVASDTIREAAALVGLPYLRLVRSESDDAFCTRVESAAAAAELLVGLHGKVLLTTGAKELVAYTVVPDYADRMYVRVLPMAESIESCVALGFRRSHVVAMQGPFSRELNYALLRHFGIAVMVSKDGGVAGGFAEKMLAAADAGVHAVVIGRPAVADGYTLDDMVAHIRERLERETWA